MVNARPGLDADLNAYGRKIGIEKRPTRNQPRFEAEWRWVCRMPSAAGETCLIVGAVPIKSDAPSRINVFPNTSRTTKSRTRKNITMKRIAPVGLPRFIYTLIVSALIVGTIGVDSGMAADKNAKVTLVYEHALPNVPGKSIKGVLVEYEPGGSSPAHTHPKSAFIYATVLEGAIRSSVNDGPVVTYRTGQSFSEMPGDRHSVSENASQTEPAKLLAVFVVDTDEKELTTPYEK